MIRTLQLQPREPELIRLCRAKTWIAVSARTQSHPGEALPTESAVRGEASTALATAVRHQAPRQVIELLLIANFHQIGVTHVSRGSVLHEALKHRVDDDVLECLVRTAIQYEQTGPSDKLSLLGCKDELGRTALHYMVDQVIRVLDRGERNHSTWSIFRTLVQAYPYAVQVMDADGNTPLVLLLLIPRFTEYTGGLELEGEVFRMVQLMASLCPPSAAVSRRLPRPWHYQHKLTDDFQRGVQGEGVPIPLSCAILHGRCMDTVKVLLEANRRIGVNACRTIVTHYREVPLHIAVSMRCSSELLITLLEEERDVLGVADIHGLMPLDWMWIRHVLDWCSTTDPFAPIMVSRRRYLGNNFLEWHERVSNQYLGLDASMEDSPNPVVRDWTRRLKDDMLKRMATVLPPMAAVFFKEYMDDTMIEGEYYVYNEEDRPWPVLHAACFLNCPLSMVRLALQSSPGHIRCKDLMMGRLPLHHAVSRGGYSVTYPIGVSCHLRSIQEISPARLVLESFPGACSVTDGFNRLPLHVAIDASKQRHDLEATFENIEATPCHNDDIDLLLQVYPNALERRDGVTKLYPFMQAAAGPGASVNTIYDLLRRNPTLVASH